MRRFLPRRLIAQMAVLIGLALLAAQLVNFWLLLNEREKLSLAQNQGPAITRFAAVASDYAEARAEARPAILKDNSRRGMQFVTSPASSVSAAEAREPNVEERLREALREQGLEAAEVRAATRTVVAERPLSSLKNERGRRDIHMLGLSARLGSVWVNGRLPTPRADPWLKARLAGATIILYTLVLGVTLLIAIRMVRPLRDLTRAAQAFGGRSDAVPVELRGPEDLRQAIEAFNTMNRRVSALLDEKDRMLGAIGHDLRTPLALLRIRAEEVEPESDRQRIIGPIEEMTAMLEDILVLARSGRAREEARRIDVASLVDAVVEEFRDLGQAVNLEPAERQVLRVQPLLVRRALRNLIDNALKYGGSAQVSVRPAAGEVRIAVADDGPGLTEEQLGLVLEPFYRVESSRSRETGGAGLGLAIAKAVAESHGGSLILSDGAPGLIATLVLREPGG
ncbi:MAG TPA: ATP-binding protein [Allosphingosinicella sp.]|nr:ATP-binding protein [Allosphingosinicella sp.]